MVPGRVFWFPAGFLVPGRVFGIRYQESGIFDLRYFALFDSIVALFCTMLRYFALFCSIVALFCTICENSEVLYDLIRVPVEDT